MKQVTYEETLFDIEDAIINDEFPGFKEDYLVLHSLIRKHKPNSFFEIGTNMGTGTQIISSAIIWDNNRKGDLHFKFYSLDLPSELAHVSLQHPISEGKGDKVGSRCTFPYTQLRGDSMTFDYSKYPCEGYFIDGEHDYEHVFHETYEVKKMKSTKIIIWHDSDIEGVWKAIYHWFVKADFGDWDLFRVTGTRIAYALRK